MINITPIVTAAAIAGAVTIAIVNPQPAPKVKITEVVQESVAVKTDPAPSCLNCELQQPTSHPVRTIPIPAVALVAPVIAPADVAPPPAEGPPEVRPRPLKEPKRAGDVCARHGGQRVDDAGKRSWHCAFPKRAAR